MVSAAFQTEMARLQDYQARVKVEFITAADVVTDITTYYKSGANFSYRKEKIPDQIQAGSFSITVLNHDNYFSEFDTDSLLYGVDYLSARIRISIGFKLADGTFEYLTQAVGYIDQLIVDPVSSLVTFRCRDRMGFILDSVLHQRKAEEEPIVLAVADGTISKIDTAPFAVIEEGWTLVCTTAGGDGVAQFSVTGSISGSVGPATSGTEFTSEAAGIRFTINAGTIDWVLGDQITFSTFQYPEFDNVNPIKIMWAVLTGYNYDTNTQEPWSDFVMDFDRTQSDANTDLDYDSFVDAIELADNIVGDVKGFVGYNQSPKDFFESLTILFDGSLFTGTDGRIKVDAFAPVFGGVTPEAEFADSEKIFNFGYARSREEIINSVTIQFQNFDAWPFSNDSSDLAGVKVLQDDDSITLYGKLPISIQSPWYQPNGVHVESVAQRLLRRYSQPPITYNFKTGLDGVLVNINDLVTITESKYNVDEARTSIIELTKNFDADSSVKNILVKVRDEELITGTNWAFLGSSADEGDGMSPQAANYDSASATDLYFVYLSQTGGGGPDYRMF